MNPFKAIDIYLGHLFAPLLIKMDLRGHRAIGFTEQDTLARIVYNRRAKDWKKYGVKLEDVRVIVEKEMRIKPVSGIKEKIGMMKAKSSIRQAIKEKRLVFLGSDRVEYTDKFGVRYTVSFWQLAKIFIDKVGVGFNQDSIVKILYQEYHKTNTIRIS